MSTEGITRVREAEDKAEDIVNDASDYADRMMEDARAEAVRIVEAARKRAAGEITALRAEVERGGTEEIKAIKERAETERRNMREYAIARRGSAIAIVRRAVE